MSSPVDYLKRSFDIGILERSDVKRRTKQLIRDHRNSIFVLFLLIIMYSAVMASFTISRYQSLEAGFYDLGIFNHDFWVRIFDPMRIAGMQSLIFGGHVAPTLYLLLPLYAIYPSCEALLVLQTLVLAAAAIPLYLIARDTFSSGRIGLAFAGAYLLYSPLHWVNRGDFHAQSLIPMLLLSTFFLYRKSTPLYMLFLFLTAFTIEFAPILVVFIGIYFLVKELLLLRKKKFDGSSVLIPVLSIVIGAAVLMFDVILVQRLQASYPPLHSLSPFGYERALPLQVVRSGTGTALSFDILLKPSIMIDLVVPDFISKLGYVALMFGFVGFVSFLAPVSVLLAIPWLVIIFLTSYPPYYSTTAHYSAQIIGQIFLSAVLGIKTLSKVTPTLSRVFPWVLLALVLLTSIGDSALSPLNSHTSNPRDPLSSRWWPSVTERDQKIKSILHGIPSNASVLATNELATQLSSRSRISVFRSDLPYPDYVAVDTKSASFSKLEESYGWSFRDLVEEATYTLRQNYDSVEIYERDRSAPVLETGTIHPIDEAGMEIKKVPIGGKIYFSGTAYTPKGQPIRNGRVHIFAEIDGRWVARSSIVLEWNSEVTDTNGAYDTRWYGKPIAENRPEWLEVRTDGVYINGQIKAWSGNPEGKLMKVFAVFLGFPNQQEFPSSIELRNIEIGP